MDGQFSPPADLVRIAASDDVAIALRDIAAGERIGALTARDAIPRGHKIALRSIAAGDQVRKYGWPIGQAMRAIGEGAHVHTHNLASSLSGEERYVFAGGTAAAPAGASAETFLGYRRADGRVGTRNEIWIIPTVGCVARTAEKIARRGNERFAGRVDGVFAFTHPFGCSQLGDDLDKTRALLAALATHPNAGGVLLIGLGCESNQLNALIAALRGAEPGRVVSFAAQGVDDEIDAGLEALSALVAAAEHDVRTPAPLGDLVLGLKCGGSDGFSGVTANPLVGDAADWLADAGGTPILTEIPEIFGAEHTLLARASDRATFDALATLVNDFKRYFIARGQRVDENPSPGNKEGGITTLEEKSLGAVQKAGRAPVTQVLRYGERVRARGLAILEAPGNDAVSSTALAAAGATLILFTTGRGTPLGFPAPTLKISSNSALAQKKPHWIDFDAGCILQGAERASAARVLQSLILATASGAPAKNELNDEREIAIWKDGVTL